jgi:hypothetical protein
MMGLPLLGKNWQKTAKTVAFCQRYRRYALIGPYSNAKHNSRVIHSNRAVSMRMGNYQKS